jgi:hypothetical protein
MTVTGQEQDKLSGPATYDNYRAWVKDGGMREVSRNNFYTRIGDMPGVKIETGHSRKRLITGVTMAFPTADPNAVVARWRKEATDD